LDDSLDAERDESTEETGLKGIWGGTAASVSSVGASPMTSEIRPEKTPSDPWSNIPPSPIPEASWLLCPTRSAEFRERIETPSPQTESDSEAVRCSVGSGRYEGRAGSSSSTSIFGTFNG
jgi:hypothetical protein